MYPFQPVSTGTGMGWGVSTNQAGEVYATGYFNKEAVFGEFTLSSSTESGYVTKISQSGEVLWASTLPSSGADYTLGYGISSASDGSVVVSGTKNQKDALIAKFDSSGKNIWQVTASNGGIAFDVVSLPDNSSVIVGYYSGSAIFGSTTLNAAGGNDVFVAKVSSNGEFIWAKSFGGTSNDTGWGIAKGEDDSVVITGQKQGAATFGAIPLYAGYPDPEAFIAKLDSSGNVLWAKDLDSPAISTSNDIATLSDGSIAITGSIKLPSGLPLVNFDGSTLNNANGVYVAKYSPDGSLLWIKDFQTNANAWGLAAGWGIGSLPNGGIVLTGNYYGRTSFGGTNLEVKFPDSNNSPEVFVAALDSAGLTTWAKALNGKDHNYGYGLDSNSAGDIFVTGNFFGDAYLDDKKIFSASGNGSTPYILKIDKSGKWSYPEMVIESSFQSLKEGDTVEFQISTNQPKGTKIYWSLEGTVDKDDFVDGKKSGVSLADSQGNLTIDAKLKSDLVTEGEERLGLSLYYESSLKNLIAQSVNYAIYDSSKTLPTYSVTISEKEIAEGETVTFTVYTTDLEPGTTLFWKLKGDGVSQADLLEGHLEGSGTISAEGQFKVKFYFANDRKREGSEKITLELFNDQSFANKVATSGYIEIKDTSQGEPSSDQSYTGEQPSRGTILTDEPPLMAGLTPLNTIFDTKPLWLNPSIFANTDSYKIANEALVPSENYDPYNNILSISRRVQVGLGVYVSVSFDLKYDSSLHSQFERSHSLYAIISSLVKDGNRKAVGQLASGSKTASGSVDATFNSHAYNRAQGNYYSDNLLSERTSIEILGSDELTISYKLGLADSGLSYLWQSAKSKLTGNLAESYFEFYDPTFKAGERAEIALSLSRQAGVESIDNLSIAANFVNSEPIGLVISSTSFDENTPSGSAVAFVNSTDPDPGDTFTYALVSGFGATDNDFFTLDGNQLQINDLPDFESKSSYSIRIRSTDQGGLSVEQVFILTVNDLPEAPPAPTYTIETVIDGSDIGEDGSGSGVYGLYHIFGLEGRNSSVLAITDADLETDASVDSSSLTTAALPLLTAAGLLFPSTNTPIAIRKDGSNLELLYKPSITSTTYQTQDFSLSTGKAIGAPAPLSSSLQSFEIPYDQDLDGDGITGPALTITETIDAADTGAGGDGTATYGLYRISGISGKSTSQLALSQADLEEGRTIAQSELDPLLPLLTTRGTSLPTAWQPRAIRKEDIDGRIELLYRPTPTATSYQTQDFSLTTGRAIGAPTPLNKSLQSFEVAYDEDLDLDGIIGLSLSVQEVVDAADQGPGGDGSATYGLYSISGINGSSAAALAVADADLEDGLLVPQSELSTLVPLLTSAGKSLPTAWQPLAIRQDAANIELLYKPTKTAATYQTQDFSLTTGKAIGKPTAALSSLISMEVPYAQDFNKDGVLGINITEIGETTAVAGTAAKDRLTLNAMDIGYAGGADDTLLVAADVSSNDPITMVGGPGNDTYTAKAGAFLVVYDLGTTKDTKDLLTGLPGTVKQWTLYKVDTNDFLLQHSNTSTAVLLVDPLGKSSAGNKLETIRFSTGAAQTMATLTNTRTGILSTEPAISYADLPDRFGYDIAFAYGIAQEAGPLSLKTELSSNLAMVV